MNKQTRINDLVARIPYGVVVNCTDGDVQPISVDFEMGYDNPEFWHDGSGSNINFDNDNIKPYLFPLSSMTEEQTEELIKLINTGQNDNNEFMRSLCRIEFYNKNHFDYRGFIPAGAAIDATDKGIYPYVKKETVEDESIKFPYSMDHSI